MPTIAQNIRSARHAAGQTQHQLALALDVLDRTVQRWEAGQHTPDVPTLRRVADALGVKLSTLIGD